VSRCSQYFCSVVWLPQPSLAPKQPFGGPACRLSYLCWVSLSTGLSRLDWGADSADQMSLFVHPFWQPTRRTISLLRYPIMLRLDRVATEAAADNPIAVRHWPSAGQIVAVLFFWAMS